MRVGGAYFMGRYRHEAKPISAYGCMFRSRLECRVASLFNTLEIAWKYEPKRFKIEKNLWYLPDFRCNYKGEVFWLEVKPKKPNKTEVKKVEGLARLSDHPVLLTINCPFWEKDFKALVYWTETEGGEVYRDSGKMMDFLRINQEEYNVAINAARDMFHRVEQTHISHRIACNERRTG